MNFNINSKIPLQTRTQIATQKIAEARRSQEGHLCLGSEIEEDGKEVENKGSKSADEGYEQEQKEIDEKGQSIIHEDVKEMSFETNMGNEVKNVGSGTDKRSEKIPEELRVDQEQMNLYNNIFSTMQEYDMASSIFGQWCELKRVVGPYIASKFCTVMIPNVSSIWISSKGIKNLQTFLSQAFPREIIYLIIEQVIGQKSLSYLLSHILRISPRVLIQVSLLHCKITERHFKRLVSAFKYLTNISFEQCQISAPRVANLSLALENTELEYLRLINCSISSHKDVTVDYQELQNLIKGLATSPDLKESLLEIHLGNMPIEEEFIRRLLEDNGFTEVKLVIFK
ncbi:unnamed protein product [Moneuplotes crassus]|uniref:Uncharacterized protein n=1 Tax=Euplotes crassus TaxID=5936 RepID=A0AAD1XBB3_EUPCR|nr:unnamed protein product [Moneuplotes crassus]